MNWVIYHLFTQPVWVNGKLVGQEILKHVTISTRDRRHKWTTGDSVTRELYIVHVELSDWKSKINEWKLIAFISAQISDGITCDVESSFYITQDSIH